MLNKNNKLFALSMRKAFRYVAFLMVVLLTFSMGCMATSSAFAISLSSSNVATSQEQDAPLSISYEFVPLGDVLNEQFFAQYAMDGEPNAFGSANADQLSTQEDFALIVWIEPQKGYYAYAHKPLIATLPTTVTLWQGDMAVDVETLYSAGLLKRDTFEVDKNMMAYVERTPIVMVIPSALLQHHKQLSVKVSGLLCSDTNCWPFKESLDISDSPAVYAEAYDVDTLAQVDEPLAETPPVIHQEIEAQIGGEQHSSQMSTSNTLDQWTFTPRYASPSLEVTGLGKALLFGLLAGLILNLMPCVLPVLGFKLSAFIAAAGQEGNKAERVRAFREHNMFFALGILTWFIVLAVVLSWAGLAWGQLFQQTPVLFALMLIVFLLALSMFGVFTLPVLDIKASTSSSPRTQAFMTGAVATLLATPCSGPLLGGVLGWAFGQSPFILGIVFVAVGLGMASPYIALSIWPKLVHKVPRAGAWTGTVEYIVGFFLMATALYLWTILPQELMAPTLYTLFVSALCAWIWGRWSGPAASTIQRILVRLCAILIIAGMSIWAFAPKDAEGIVWYDFDAVSVQQMLGHEPLILEFTADWCPNCKVLERTTLTHDNVREWAKDYGVRFIRVDLTRNETANDAAAEALLHALGSRSIPLVALFPSGEEYTSPLVLRDIFTPSQMEDALKEAFEGWNGKI